MTAGAVAEVLDTPGLSAYVDAVEHALESAVALGDGAAVAGAGSETLRSGGKRLRPMLVYLSSPVAGRGRDALVAAGVAVELVHMATLVHDDQLDAARLRRGRPTVWAAHGEVVARATGDYLFARAFAVLVETGDMEAVTLLSDACLALARGEILQREQAGNPETTPEQYLERCRLKTGRLFAAAAMLGGRFGGLAGPVVDRLGEFATALGLAFQIADDILDCDGRPDTTGKPLGTDLLDGTVTLPLILGARRDAAVGGVIARGATPEDVLPTLARIARSGAVRDARAVAERHADEALAHIDSLDGGLDSASLRAVVRGAIDRDA
jgi:geranylgeranyl pyrophosphate synthase